MKRKLIECLSYLGVIAFIFLLNIYTEGKSMVPLMLCLIMIPISNPKRDFDLISQEFLSEN